LGALVHYISDPERKNFQPMNANYGLFPGLDKDGRMRKKDKRMLLAGRALREMEAWFQTSDPFAGSDGQRAAGDH
jgi:methylenetetrahydrofolate--tRNA-(uracil-5-)-methyltransferase